MNKICFFYYYYYYFTFNLFKYQIFFVVVFWIYKFNNIDKIKKIDIQNAELKNIKYKSCHFIYDIYILDVKIKK
jgi:hypothetical protein